MSKSLSDKLTNVPWQALAAVLFILPCGSVLLTRHLAGGVRAPATLQDIPVTPPPAAVAARSGAANSDGFDVMSAKDWVELRERVNRLVIANSPFGGDTRRVSLDRAAQDRVNSDRSQAATITKQAASQAAKQEPESFPSQVHLTSVMRVATKGPVTAEVARLNARAVVGGKLRKVGQEAAPGWTIEFIDVAAGTMLVRSQNGTEATLTLRKPESEQRQGADLTAPQRDVPGPMTLPVDLPKAPPTGMPRGPQADAPVGPPGGP